MKNASRRLAALCEINQSVQYYDMPAMLYDMLYLKYKAQFDSAVKDKIIRKEVEEKQEYYQATCENIHANAEMYAWYSEQLRSLPSVITPEEAGEIHLKYKTALKIETKLISKMTITPPSLDPVFVFQYRYRSPKGQNVYTASFSANVSEVEATLDSIAHSEEKRQSAAYQRQLMSPSLRYDIMQRDNFRCVLCGKSAEEDGVKLHVDHIVPVSKGGKTVPENLRTLCEDCNLGKGAKYDPAGVN